MKSYYLIILVFLFTGTLLVSYASEEMKTNEERRFNKESIDEYKANDDFFYLETQSPKTNYIQKIRNWFFYMIRKMLGNTLTEFVVGYIPYILIGIALFLIVYKISGVSLESFGFKPKKMQQTELDIESTQIEEVDFQLLIKEALKKKDYRLAIRYNYLDILKSLSLLGLISHSRYKSNIEYTYELKDKQMKNGFRQVVYVFDRIWYGEYHPDNTLFQEINQEFELFKKQLPVRNNVKEEG